MVFLYKFSKRLLSQSLTGLIIFFNFVIIDSIFLFNLSLIILFLTSASLTFVTEFVSTAAKLGNLRITMIIITTREITIIINGIIL